MNKYISLVPSVPHGPMVDRSGNITSDWMNFFSQVVQYLQNNLSTGGTTPPSYTAAEINQLTSSKNGARVYNTTTDKAMIKENGVFKTITTS